MQRLVSEEEELEHLAGTAPGMLQMRLSCTLHCPRFPGSFDAQMVTKGLVKDLRPAHACSVVPGTSLTRDGNTRGPAM